MRVRITESVLEAVNYLNRNNNKSHAYIQNRTIKQSTIKPLLIEVSYTSPEISGCCLEVGNKLINEIELFLQCNLDEFRSAIINLFQELHEAVGEDLVAAHMFYKTRIEDCNGHMLDSCILHLDQVLGYRLIWVLNGEGTQWVNIEDVNNTILDKFANEKSDFRLKKIKEKYTKGGFLTTDTSKWIENLNTRLVNQNNIFTVPKNTILLYKTNLLFHKTPVTIYNRLVLVITIFTRFFGEN
jgi:hypothetical protein